MKMKMRHHLAVLALLLPLSSAMAQGQAPTQGQVPVPGQAPLPGQAQGQPSGPGHDISPEKRAAIEKLLEATGSLQLGQQLSQVMVTQLTNTLRAAHANIPQKALDLLPEVVNSVVAENLGTFKESVIHIYDAHLSLQDVQGLNQFYSSDLGRKVIRTLPVVLQESIQAGQSWGQALGPEIARRIQARFQQEGVTL